VTVQLIRFHSCAGTGKSLLLKKIVHELNKIQTASEAAVTGDASPRSSKEPTGRSYQVTALTGIAAASIGGITLHRFAGIQLGRSAHELGKAWSRKKNWRATDILIIDEISMMAPVLFHRLERLAREIRGNEAPFGGMQLVLSGDFLQLPPVPDAVDYSIPRSELKGNDLLFFDEAVQYERKKVSSIPSTSYLFIFVS
jgi:ATP-dependent DNA helicase PIF1